MTKAWISNNAGDVTVEGNRVFPFAVEDGILTVVSDDDDVVCQRSIRADNGEEKNETEILGIACEEVGGCFD